MSIAPNTSRLLQRLTSLAPLSAEEIRALEGAAGPARLHRPHEDLARESETATHIDLLVSGFACRCRMLPDGRRQIISYLIPGDLCDVRHLLQPVATHTISTLTAANVAPFGREQLLGLIERHPRIGYALCSLALVEELIVREWLVSVGQRTAIERLAHLLCEIFTRMQSVGLTDRGRCELPLTQMELADSLALSTVHVNRTLQELRRQGLVSLAGGMLEIHDIEALRTIAMFNPAYLQSGNPQPHSPMLLSTRRGSH
ncbi:MAG TPA: Crp/Fnr family transcriptional regulator [Steroidobacteraceae bacterium]|nr:Crp/Fnr family transcriptional regulator [Steroidobacteraceae bacterium]